MAASNLLQTGPPDSFHPTKKKCGLQIPTPVSYTHLPHARVIRNGKETILNAADLVPGEIIRLEAGDFIPADARLLHSVSLKSEESALTGESVPAEKDTQPITCLLYTSQYENSCSPPKQRLSERLCRPM